MNVILFVILTLSGLPVNYARPFPCLPAGMMNIRVLILLWTGDYPAQHEVGKFIKHGILPCRRDKLKGKFTSFECDWPAIMYVDVDSHSL